MLAIYSRVSTMIQVSTGTSLEGQVELCYKKAKELNINKSDILPPFIEKGETGEDIDRPKMNEIRKMVSEGIITKFMCIDPDRLSRDMTDKLIVCKEFEKYEVDIIFVDSEYSNTPEGQLFFNMRSAIAQFELQQIKKRTTRGRLQAVEKHGKIMPMRVAPYGYNLIDGKLIINEKEEEFVKLIYKWYIYDNLTMRQIGEKLYNLGAIPKRGESKNWGASSILRILSSEIYIGNYYYNKRKTQKIKGEKTKSGKAKKEYTFRDESQWLKVEIPAIIDIETYQLAQKQKEKNTKHAGNAKHNYLLKSLLKCECCGRIWNCVSYPGKMNKETGKKMTYPCYRCPNMFPKKYGDGVKKCESKSIRTDMLDDYVWEDIKDMILNNGLDRIQSLENDFNIIPYKKIIIALNKQIEQKTKEKDKIKIMFKNDIIDENELISEIKKNDIEIKNVQKELDKYNQIISNQSGNLNEALKLNEIIDYLKLILNNKGELSFEEKRHFAELIIDEITIGFENEEVILTYSGILDEYKKEKIINEANFNCIDLCLQHQHDMNTNLCNFKPIFINYQSKLMFLNLKYPQNYLLRI